MITPPTYRTSLTLLHAGSFDWHVPIELDPGKYLFRISPVTSDRERDLY
jgi:hypothetical protein